MLPADHASTDERLVLLDEAMKRHHHQPDALIEVLHRAQGLFGHLDEGVLLHVARSLKLPPSRVQGVATFYHLFRLQPRGAHTCVVCTGTACFLKGADRLLQVVESVAGVGPGETTRDGNLTVLTARCIDACGLAPAVVLDEATPGGQSPESLAQRLKRWL